MLTELIVKLQRHFLRPLPLYFYEFPSAGFHNRLSRIKDFKTRQRRGRNPSVTPALVELERRILLTGIVVNNPTDVPVEGQIDLRQAIVQANSNGGDQTITFDSTVFATSQTISLTGSQLELSDITGNETIIGPAAGLTVDGGGLSRVFQVDTGVTASISGLTISGGSASNGGAVFLTLSNIN